MSGATVFPDLNALAAHFRQVSESKRYILIFAHNGIGKTRLSMAFKDIGQTVNADGKTEKRDTLYFNAFTEDLFSWDNDLDKGIERKLKLNRDSRFFAGLESMEMDNRIRALLGRYADFDFQIDTATWEVVFDREMRVKKNGGVDAGQSKVEDCYETFRDEAIKISRSEENIFIWCFFLAVVELALDNDGDGPYNWVKHIYVDDPISSLDDHHAIAVANHLAQLLKRSDGQHGAVISTHHALFFNVLYSELKSANQYFLDRDRSNEGYLLREIGKTPFFIMSPRWLNSTRWHETASCTRITSTCSARSWKRRQVSTAIRISTPASSAARTMKKASCIGG